MPKGLQMPIVVSVKLGIGKTVMQIIVIPFPFFRCENGRNRNMRDNGICTLVPESDMMRSFVKNKGTMPYIDEG